MCTFQPPIPHLLLPSLQHLDDSFCCKTVPKKEQAKERQGRTIIRKGGKVGRSKGRRGEERKERSGEDTFPLCLGITFFFHYPNIH